VTRGQISARQQAVLQEIGIDVWLRRGVQPEVDLQLEDLPPINEPAVDVPVVDDPAVEVPAPAGERAPDDWRALNAEIQACQACDLHKSRTQAVAGVGKATANWLVIGEAPGVEEDQAGEPFVGPAGQLLDQMLIAAGQPREQVFITNILKCMPPNDRDPKLAEVASCMPYLERQIRLLNPQLILVVGRIAAQNLLQTETSVGQLRGRVHQHNIAGREVPVVVTYHPAYLLRSPSQKRKAWEDLQLAMKLNADFAG